MVCVCVCAAASRGCESDRLPRALRARSPPCSCRLTSSHSPSQEPPSTSPSPFYPLSSPCTMATRIQFENSSDGEPFRRPYSASAFRSSALQGLLFLAPCSLAGVLVHFQLVSSLSSPTRESQGVTLSSRPFVHQLTDGLLLYPPRPASLSVALSPPLEDP